MAIKTKSVDEPKVVEQVKFTKDKILSANKYKNRIDILKTLLVDDKEYSFEQVDGMMDDFMKGKVK